MAWVLLETEAHLCLGPQCLVWGLAQGTGLLTEGSGPGAGRSPGAGRQQEMERRLGRQLCWGTGQGAWRGGQGQSWAHLGLSSRAAW